LPYRSRNSNSGVWCGRDRKWVVGRFKTKSNDAQTEIVKIRRSNLDFMNVCGEAMRLL
jgi:hypothetical protein